MHKLNSVLARTFFLLYVSLFTSTQSQINWITKAPLPNLLTECGSVTLNDKIYIIGGLEPGGVSTTKVHVYDPLYNSWSMAAPLPMALHHMPCAAANGKIYVLGGYTSNPFQPVSDTYEYDPVANKWTIKTPVPTVRGAASAAEMNGKIYVIGGAGYNLLQSTDVNEVYNPLSDTWETKAPMPTARDHHAVISLDTLIYSIGGRNFSLNIGSSGITEAYSPASNKWYLIDSLFWIRSGFSLGALNGKIYAVGGEWFSPSGSGIVAHIEVFDPKLNNWEFLTTMNTTRHGLGLGIVNDTIYTISGGIQAGFSYSDVNEAFAPDKSIGIQPISEAANEYKLYQNYPNPFNPITKIEFQIKKRSNVLLNVYDITGREIHTLLNMQIDAGSYSINWDASNYPSGVYIYKILATDFTDAKKMILLK